MGKVTVDGAKRHDVLRGYRFRVLLVPPKPGIAEDIGAAFSANGSSAFPIGFQSVTGLSGEAETVEYREGTDEITMHKFEGLVSYGDVTFAKGIDPDEHLWAWWQRVHGDSGPALGPLASVKTSGGSAPKGRRNVQIEVLERGGGFSSNAVRVYELVNAWPKSYEIGDMDAASSDVLVESLVIAHEGIRVKVKNSTVALPADTGAETATG